MRVLKTRPYNRAKFNEETRILVEETSLDNQNDDGSSSEMLEPYTIVSAKPRTEQDVTYPFHFEGRTLVIGKDRREQLKRRLMAAIQKGAEAENPKEKRYWRGEVRQVARKLKRYNYFPPGNMLVWPIYFQGERMRFGRPVEYNSRPLSKYDSVAPYTREYAPTASKEKSSAFAAFALHFPTYDLRQGAIISMN